MGCRGAIHCAHLGSRGIPQGAMNCAPTPCAYLKCIDPCGQPGARPRCHSFPPELSFVDKVPQWLLYGFVPQTVREKAPAQKSSDCISESIC